MERMENKRRDKSEGFDNWCNLKLLKPINKAKEDVTKVS